MIQMLVDAYSNISGFCFMAGLLLLAHGHNRKTYIKRLLKLGTKTEGKVVEIYQNPGSLFGKKAGEGFAPIVEYTTVSGNSLKHYSRTFRTPSSYQVGQIIPLWYIDYRSQREATLEDDEPGSLPRKLLLTGSILILISLPKIISALNRLA